MEDEVDDRYAGIDIDSLLNRNDKGRNVYYGRKKALYEAPEFLQRLNGEETLLEGQALCLECKVGGFPVPTLRWYKDDEQIIEHPRIKVESDGKGGYALMIDNVMRGDEAAYRCRAENVEGACSSVFFLSVRAKPKSPKKDSQRSPNRRTVSFPPMFSTIVEKVEEEEKQGKEFELLPPSPLTDSYYALTLKSRATWPAFLGDWAFKNGAHISRKPQSGRRGSDSEFIPNGDIPEPQSPSEGRKNARRSLTRSDLTARVEAKKQRLEEEKKRQEEERKRNEEKEKEAAKKKKEEEREAAKKRKEEEDLEARKLETKLIMEREERRRKRAELENESAQKEEAMRKRREARAERLEKERREREEEEAKLKRQQMEEENKLQEKLELERKQAEEDLKRLQEEKLKEDLLLKEKKEKEEKERRRMEQKRQEEKRQKEEEEQSKKRKLNNVRKEEEEKNSAGSKSFKKEEPKGKLHASIGLFEKRQQEDEERKSPRKDIQDLKTKATKDIKNNVGAATDQDLKPKPKALSMFQQKTEAKPPPPAPSKPHSTLMNSSQENVESKQAKQPGKLNLPAALNQAAQEKPGLYKAGSKHDVGSNSKLNDLSEPQINHIPEKPALKKTLWQKRETLTKGDDSAQENNSKQAAKSNGASNQTVKLKEEKSTVSQGKVAPKDANWKKELQFKEEKKRAEQKSQGAIAMKKEDALKKEVTKTETEKKFIPDKKVQAAAKPKQETINQKEQDQAECQKKKEQNKSDAFIKQEAQRELLEKRKKEEEARKREQKEKEEQEKMRMQFRKEQIRKEQLKRQQEEEIKRKQQKQKEELLKEEREKLTAHKLQSHDKQELLAVDGEEDFQVKVYKRDYSFSDLRKSLEMTLTEGGTSVMNVEEHKYWDDILVKHNYSIGDRKKSFDTFSSGSATLDRPARLRSRRNSIEELEKIQLKRSSSISDLRESYTKSLERPKHKKKTSAKENVQKDGEILKRTANVNETRQQLLETVKKQLEPLTSGRTAKEADITIRNLKPKSEGNPASSRPTSPKPLADAGVTSLSANVKSKRASIHEMMSQQSEAPAMLRIASSSNKDLSKRKSYHGHDAYGSREIPVYKRAAGWADNIGKPQEGLPLQTSTADARNEHSTKGAASLDSRMKSTEAASSKSGKLPLLDKKDTTARPFVFNSTRTIARKPSVKTSGNEQNSVGDDEDDDVFLDDVTTDEETDLPSEKPCFITNTDLSHFERERDVRSTDVENRIIGDTNVDSLTELPKTKGELLPQVIVDLLDDKENVSLYRDQNEAAKTLEHGHSNLFDTSTTPQYSREEREPTPFLQVSREEREPTPFLEVSREEREPTPFLQVSGEEREPTQFSQVSREEREPTPFLQVSREEREPTPFLQVSREERSREEREPTPFLQVSREEREPTPFLQVSREEREPTPLLQVSRREKEPTPFLSVSREEREPTPFMSPSTGKSKKESTHREKVITSARMNTAASLGVPNQEDSSRPVQKSRPHMLTINQRIPNKAKLPDNFPAESSPFSVDTNSKLDQNGHRVVCPSKKLEEPLKRSTAIEIKNQTDSSMKGGILSQNNAWLQAEECLKDGSVKSTNSLAKVTPTGKGYQQQQQLTGRRLQTSDPPAVVQDDAKSNIPVRNSSMLGSAFSNVKKQKQQHSFLEKSKVYPLTTSSSDREHNQHVKKTNDSAWSNLLSRNLQDETQNKGDLKQPFLTTCSSVTKSEKDEHKGLATSLVISSDKGKQVAFDPRFSHFTPGTEPPQFTPNMSTNLPKAVTEGEESLRQTVNTSVITSQPPISTSLLHSQISCGNATSHETANTFRNTHLNTTKSSDLPSTLSSPARKPTPTKDEPTEVVSTQANSTPESEQTVVHRLRQAGTVFMSVLEWIVLPPSPPSLPSETETSQCHEESSSTSLEENTTEGRLGSKTKRNWKKTRKSKKPLMHGRSPPNRLETCQGLNFNERLVKCSPFGVYTPQAMLFLLLLCFVCLYQNIPVGKFLCYVLAYYYSFCVLRLIGVLK